MQTGPAHRTKKGCRAQDAIAPTVTDRVSLAPEPPGDVHEIVVDESQIDELHRELAIWNDVVWSL